MNDRDLRSAIAQNWNALSAGRISVEDARARNRELMAQPGYERAKFAVLAAHSHKSP